MLETGEWRVFPAKSSGDHVQHRLQSASRVQVVNTFEPWSQTPHTLQCLRHETSDKNYVHCLGFVARNQHLGVEGLGLQSCTDGSSIKNCYCALASSFSSTGHAWVQLLRPMETGSERQRERERRGRERESDGEERQRERERARERERGKR